REAGSSRAWAFRPQPRVRRRETSTVAAGERPWPLGAAERTAPCGGRAPAAGRGPSGGFLEALLLVALAVDAQAGPRHDVEALEGDLAAAVGAHAEAIGLAVERAERVVDPVDEPALLAREEETLLLLDRVRPLVREVQRVQREVAITAHARVARILVEAGEHLECPLAFAQQPLLQVCPLRSEERRV